MASIAGRVWSAFDAALSVMRGEPKTGAASTAPPADATAQQGASVALAPSAAPRPAALRSATPTPSQSSSSVTGTESSGDSAGVRPAGSAIVAAALLGSVAADAPVIPRPVPAAAPAGGPPGNGGDPPPPRGGGPPEISLDVRLLSPAPGATITGAQPGATFTATAYATAAQGDLPDPTLSVDVWVDGHLFPAVASGSDATTFAAECRVYRSGQLNVVASAFAKGSGAKSASKDTSPGIQVQSTLASEEPDLTVQSPSVGQVVALPVIGGTVALACSTSGDFGLREVTWACDGHSGSASAGQDSAGQEPFEGQVQIDGASLGKHTITVTCQQLHLFGVPVGTPSTVIVPVTVTEAYPPAVTITSPADSAELYWDDTGLPNGLPVTVTGIATGVQSGMGNGTVKLQLDNGSFNDVQTANLTPDTSAVNWSTNVTLQDGDHTITVDAFDGVLNTPGTASVRVNVRKSYVAKDLNERLDHRAYLDALLGFAGEAMRSDAGATAAGLTDADFQRSCYQRFNQLRMPLSQSTDAGNAAVNELRVVVEVLRSYLAGSPSAPQPTSDGEPQYRATAYAALLAGLGTSDTELRLARGAGNDVRAALAARLGLPATDSQGGSTLDQLLLAPAAVTEDALRSMRGSARFSPSVSNSKPTTTPRSNSQTKRSRTGECSTTSGNTHSAPAT